MSKSSSTSEENVHEKLRLLRKICEKARLGCHPTKESVQTDGYSGMMSVGFSLKIS